MIKKIITLGIFFISIQFFVQANNNMSTSDQYFLYIGTYTETDDEGIVVYKFDATNGDLEYLTTEKGVKNPSYLAINSKKKILIAVNEIGNYKGEKAGSVSAFKIDDSNGHLNKLNLVSSGGSSPCYVSINKSGSLAFVSNYSGGNVSVIPIDPDGTLRDRSDLEQHTGKSIDESRQKAPYAHSIVLSPKGDFALAVDLGIDKVISYEINSKKGSLLKTAQFSLTPGSGPRHLTFHPNKKLAFIINELNSTVTSCTYNPNGAVLSEVMSVSTLPEGYNEKSYCADVHVSPDGRYLYGSNRGHDSIVIFEINQKTGELSFVDHQSVKGNWPRNFTIDPTGKFLLVANQRSNNVVVFKIDKETGKLKSNGVEIEVSKPVCLKMMSMQ